MMGEDALKVSSPYSREDQAFSASQLGNGPGGALLNEVLRQLDQERSERLAETTSLKTDVRSQQVVLAQIAETVLGPTLQDGMESLQKDQQRQQQAQDLQAAALREGLLDLAKQKENLAKQAAELQELRTGVCGSLATELSELGERTTQSGMLVASLQASLEEGLRGSMQQSQNSTEKCQALLEDRLRSVSQQCQVSVDECQTLLETTLHDVKQHCQETADKSLEEGLRSVSQQCQASLEEGLRDATQYFQELVNKSQASLEEGIRQVKEEMQLEFQQSVDQSQVSLEAGLRSVSQEGQSSLEEALGAMKQQCEESLNRSQASLEEGLCSVSQKSQASLEEGLREVKQQCQESIERSQALLDEGMRKGNESNQACLEEGLRDVVQKCQESVDKSQASLEVSQRDLSKQCQASLEAGLREMGAQCQQLSQASVAEALRSVTEQAEASLEDGLRDVSQQGQASLEEGLRDMRQHCQESIDKSHSSMEESLRDASQQWQEKLRGLRQESSEVADKSPRLADENLRSCVDNLDKSQALLADGLLDSSQQLEQFRSTLNEYAERLTSLGPSFQQHQRAGQAVAQHAKEAREAAEAAASAESRLSAVYKEAQEQLALARSSVEADVATQSKTAAELEAIQAAAEVIKASAEAAAMEARSYANEAAKAASRCEQHSSGSGMADQVDPGLSDQLLALKGELQAAPLQLREELRTWIEHCQETRRSVEGIGSRVDEALDTFRRQAPVSEAAALDSSSASFSHLEEMISLAMERTEQNEQNLLAVTSSTSGLQEGSESLKAQVKSDMEDLRKQLRMELEQVTADRELQQGGQTQAGTALQVAAVVEAAMEALQSDMEDLRKQLRMELEQVTADRELQQGGQTQAATALQGEWGDWGLACQELRQELDASGREACERLEALEAMQRSGASQGGSAAARPTEASEEEEQAVVVRSQPAALHGLIEPARPVGPSAVRRKALVIGCSYWESQCPLAGALNDSWNVLSLLRHSLQYGENQVRHLVDGSSYFKTAGPKRPTLAAITEGLHWLTSEAEPGDEVFIFFAGYGTLRPLGVGTFEACIVPADYADQSADSGGFKLLRMAEISRSLARLPATCKATIVLDCCHASLPGVDGQNSAAIQWVQMQPGTFPGAEVSPHVFTPRARRLVLPPTGPVQQASPPDSSVPEVTCAATCYLACHQAQWCAELAIEGVMQGAFTWSWVKAMVDGNLQGSAAQLRSSLAANLGSLQQRHCWFDQAPVMQSSRSAALQDSLTAELPHMVPRPICVHQPQRKALLIGANYSDSFAPLKGAINDAWNMYSVLRHAFQFADDQIRILVDGEHGQRLQASQLPTRENILTQLQWLMEGAQPGDSLVLLFCGYGTQHPRERGSKEQEAYLVPSDFAADVPQEFLGMPDGSASAPRPSPADTPCGSPAASFVAPAKAPPAGARYRLISLLEVNRFMAQIPRGATLTTILDCAYPVVPGIGPSYNLPPTFQKVARGRVDYRKLHDFVSRPRFLELPPLPVQHTPPQLYGPREFPQCRLHCFCACRLPEWDSELPLEGTVQGIFTWALAKAFVAGGFKSSVAQLQEEVTRITIGLKEHFQGVGQTPVLMLSQAASLQDVVLE